MDVERDPFFMLKLMAPMTIIYMVMMLLVIPFVLYLIARWRAHRDSIVDPQLGLKVALNYFAVTGFQLALAGVMLVVYSMISTETDARGDLARMGFGLIFPAMLVLFVHRALLKRTNQHRFTSVERLFAGYNLFVTGLIGFIGLVLAFEMLLKKGPGGEMGRIAAALVLVYGSGWAVVGWRFARLVFGDESEPGSPPASTGSPSSAPAAPSGSALPPLGGGSFPPIDRR
jgi:hypothetical protein